MKIYDVLYIGAGHNALVCAGYLAKAGYRVLVLERRASIGGAVVTEEIIPGFHFDLGGSAHILIHHTPIVKDLALETYGLEYIDIDPLFFAPFPDGTSITIWKDIEKTCESIAKVSPEDAENYRRFIKTWTPLAKGMVDAFLSSPTPWNLIKSMGIGTGIGIKTLDRVRDIMNGYGAFLRQTFKSPKVQALIGWMAAQSGPPPTEPMSAPFALWHPMYHVSGIKRPRGGSGMLTKALAKMIQDHQGEVQTNTPVKKILVEDGKAVGVETEKKQQFRARKVVSGAHIHTTLALIEKEHLPKRSLALLQKTRIGNGFGMIVRYAMKELPNYLALPSEPDNRAGAQHHALQFICPELDYLEAAYGDYLGGRPSQNPALIAMTFSAIDPSLAPRGKHTLFLWGQYFPYELASKESWDDIQKREADRMLNTLAQYAPNVKEAVIDEFIESPLFLERELGLLRGNVMHLEMSIDQMFFQRPALTMGNYRGPIKELYFTGASTHPGGGIMGAAGYNAAKVLLKDLAFWRFWR